MTDSAQHAAVVVLWSGTASADEVREARDHVRGCATCQAELSRVGKAVDALEGGTVGRLDEVPPAGGLERLLAKVKQTNRVVSFDAEVAALFDLSRAAAQALLNEAAGAEGWEEGPAPGVWLWPVVPGPKVGQALTALVKLEPGATFPEHEHLGLEHVLVLEGGYCDSGGLEVWRGETQPMSRGTSHSFTAFDDVGCLCASRQSLPEHE